MHAFRKIPLKRSTADWTVARASQANLLRIAWVGFGPLLGDSIFGSCRLRYGEGHAEKRAATAALLAGMSHAHVSILRMDPGLVESF